MLSEQDRQWIVDRKRLRELHDTAVAGYPMNLSEAERREEAAIWKRIGMIDPDLTYLDIIERQQAEIERLRKVVRNLIDLKKPLERDDTDVMIRCDDRVYVFRATPSGNHRLCSIILTTQPQATGDAPAEPSRQELKRQLVEAIRERNRLFDRGFDFNIDPNGEFKHAVDCAVDAIKALMPVGSVVTSKNADGEVVRGTATDVVRWSLVLIQLEHGGNYAVAWRSVTNPPELADAWCEAHQPSEPEQPIRIKYGVRALREDAQGNLTEVSAIRVNACNALTMTQEGNTLKVQTEWGEIRTNLTERGSAAARDADVITLHSEHGRQVFQRNERGEAVPLRTMEADAPPTTPTPEAPIDRINALSAQLTEATNEIAAASTAIAEAQRRRDLAIERKCAVQAELDAVVKGQRQSSEWEPFTYIPVRDANGDITGFKKVSTESW